MGRWVVQATVGKRLHPSFELRMPQQSDFVPVGTVLAVRPLVPKIVQVQVNKVDES